MKCMKKGVDIRRVREAAVEKMQKDGFSFCTKSEWKKTTSRVREDEAPRAEKAVKKVKGDKKRMRGQKAEKAEAAKAESAEKK